MRSHIRRYLAWSAFGALLGPALWVLYSVWHVSHYHPEHGTFSDVFREALALLATGEETPLLLSMSMPAGAILLVVIRAVVAAITSTISRVGPHGKGRKTVNDLPEPNKDMSDSQSPDDGIVQRSPITA